MIATLNCQPSAGIYVYSVALLFLLLTQVIHHFDSDSIMRMILLWIEPMYMVGHVWVIIDDDIIIKGNRFSWILDGFLREFVVVVVVFILYIIFIRLVHTHIWCTLLSPFRFRENLVAHQHHICLWIQSSGAYGNETSLFHCVYHSRRRHRRDMLRMTAFSCCPFYIHTHTRYRPTSSRPIYIHLYLVLYLILNLHSSLSIFAQQWW
jgi:hypothetical protein